MNKSCDAVDITSKGIRLFHLAIKNKSIQVKIFMSIAAIYWGIFLPSLSIAQTELQVVEKTVIEKITLSATETFKVILEKADVNITGWDGSHVQIKLVFSSKHTDRLVAQEELEYMKYSLIREGREVQLANTYLIPPNVSRLKGSLNLVCEIMLPFQKQLNILGKYGNIEVKGARGTISILSEFGTIDLSDVDGSLMVQSSFSNIKGDHIKGNFTCTADKSEIDLSDMIGNFVFNTSYGKIDLNFGEQLKTLSIKSNRTTVAIHPENFKRYNYDLSTTHSNIFLKEPFQKMIQDNGSNSSFNFLSGAGNPLIKIQTTYSPITIKF